MSVQIFKSRVAKAQFHLKNGKSLVFAPSAYSPSIGFIATADPIIIAELQDALNAQGDSGGILFQDNEPILLPEVAPLTAEEQEKAIKAHKENLKPAEKSQSDAVTKLALEAAKAAEAAKQAENSKNPNPNPATTGMVSSANVGGAAKIDF